MTANHELVNVEHVVLFGSRAPIRWRTALSVRNYVNALPNRTVVVVSNGSGVDRAALMAAIERCKAGTLAGLIVCPAMWKDYQEIGNRNAAGPVRNSLQAKLGDRGVSWRKEGPSSGTDDQAAKLERLGKVVVPCGAVA